MQSCFRFIYQSKMTLSSLVLEFDGNSSLFKEKYFPPIELDSNGEYVAGLIDFQAYNSVPNVDEYNNKLYYGHYEEKPKETKKTVLTVPQGVFPIDEFCIRITQLFQANGFKLNIHFNKKTSKFEFICDKIVNFTVKDSAANIFGFNNRKLNAEILHISDNIITLVSNKLYIDDMNKLFVSSNFNKLYIEEPEKEKFNGNVITIPTGCYEIEDINKFLSESLGAVKFILRVNKNTLKCELLCDQDVDMRANDSIGQTLGFSKKILRRNVWHTSDKIIDIIRINFLRIECDIITGSYVNNRPSHIIHAFSPKVENGYKIQETVNSVIYLPITVDSISEIALKIVDQNNRLVNFRGEKISLRIHIKKL